MRKRKTILLALFILLAVASSFLFATYSYAITISGAETITTNSSASYSAADCNGTVTWNVTGTGAGISSNGVLTTGSASCGGITVTARCSDGTSATKTARVTNAGQWVVISDCGHSYSWCWAITCSAYFSSGKYLYYDGYYCPPYPWCFPSEWYTAAGRSTPCPSHGAACSGCFTIWNRIWEWQCPTCTNGQTISCYSGASETNGVGECKAGTQTCVNGQWGECEGEVLPATEEICGDNIDNNCDGNTDEGCVVCTDMDGDGYYAISATCPQGNDCNDGDNTIYPGAKEKCDGIDNNCDGQKDETCLGNQCGIPLGSTATPASGNLYHDQTLFQTTTSGFTLSYNSIDIYNGSLGKGWTHNWNSMLFSTPDGTIGLKQGDGNVTYFRLSNGIYYPESQSGDTSYITVNNDNTYTRTLKNGTTYNFNPSGKLTSIKDRNNNTTTLTYSGDNLTTITDLSGRTIYLTYDSQNKITSITDPSNNIYTFTYANDTLIRVSFPLVGNPSGWLYSYDANGRMLTKTDPQGYLTTYAYDNEGRVTSSIDPEGKTKSITYDQTTNTAVVTEKDGGVWTYKYDPLLNVTTQKTDPQGNTTAYTYDQYKDLISTREADGSITSYTYDEYGNMASVTDPTGNTTSYTYNEFGQTTSVTDSEGNVTGYEYDSNGNQTAVIDSTGAITRYQYDSRGNLTKVTNPLGQATTFTYDQYNNMTSVTDPQGKTTRYAYDSAGNMIAMMDSSGNATEYIYDSLNRLIKIIEPNGIITTYTYDARGNRTAVTDGNLNVIQYAYNYKDQLTKVLDPLSGITAYEYGGTGCPSCSGSGDKLTAIVDAKGNRTTYDYDTLGRLIRETDSLGKTITYAYDSKSNLVSKTDSNGNIITYSYDALNRLVKKTYPDGTAEEYRYDSKGNIIYVANQWIAYNFVYDAKGRLISVTDSNGRVIKYEYDVMGNRISMTTPEGKIIIYKYDSNNRLTEIVIASGEWQSQVFGFMYDSLGRRIKLINPNGTYTTYSYDKNSRLTELVHKNSKGSIINSFTYTHDKVGNRLSKTEMDKKTTYTYDPLYRLTQALPTKFKGKDKEQENKAESFSYDSVGNRLAGPRTKDYYSYNEGNQLINDRKHQYEYDNNGNLAKKIELDDNNKQSIWTYFYDFENRLSKVVQQDNDDAVIVSFKYDPFGKRIEKKVEGNEGIKVYNYVYDNEDIILEYETKTDGKIETTRYTHGLGIDGPLAIEQKGDMYYYHADGLGSIIALTDARQKVVQSYTYDSFGGFKKQGDKVKDFYTFTGRIWDKDIKLYDYRNRFYDPKIGRFITYDPSLYLRGSPEIPYLLPSLLETPQELNPYVYALSNPQTFIDPFGLCASGVYYVSGVEYGGFLFFVGVKTAHLKFTCIGDSKDTFTATLTSLSIGGGLGGGVGTPAGVVKGCNKEEAISNFTGFGGSVTIYPGPFGLPSKPGFGSSAYWSSNFKAGGIAPGYGIEASGGGSYTFKW